MGRQPLLDARRGVRVQYVDHRAAFQVDDDRAVGQSFALRPLVNADDPRAGDRPSGARFQPAQDGVVAHAQSEAVNQSFARSSTQGMTDQVCNDIRSAGAGGRARWRRPVAVR